MNFTYFINFIKSVTCDLQYLLFTLLYAFLSSLATTLLKSGDSFRTSTSCQTLDWVLYLVSLPGVSQLWKRTAEMFLNWWGAGFECRLEFITPSWGFFFLSFFFFLYHTLPYLFRNMLMSSTTVRYFKFLLFVSTPWKLKVAISYIITLSTGHPSKMILSYFILFEREEISPATGSLSKCSQ